jgi:putative tryptophan/tyrosine transport system substrate-binding protein
VRRREFITLLGGAAAMPLTARAQERVRRLAVLMSNVEGDVEQKARIAAFLEILEKAGWIEGRNLRIDYRFGATDAARIRISVTELAGLAPDVAFVSNQPLLEAMRQASGATQIVFLGVTDPLDQGLVASLARPGGSITGFTPGEFSTGAKWLELLREIAPNIKHAAVLMTPTNASNVGHFRAIEDAARASGIRLTKGDVQSVEEIDRAIDQVAREPDGGLIVTANPITLLHRERIVLLAGKHRLPAVYPFRYFVASGGLMSYGTDTLDLYRQAATYVDRILKGAKAGDLPVQQPTKFELVLNLKAARALGLTVPPTLLSRADEVIE